MSDAQIVRDGAFRFHVEGEMTFATATGLLRQSESYFNTSQNLEIDLSRVTAADSAGLALLLEWTARARVVGAAVSFEGLPEALRSIAHLCRIEPLLSLTDTEASA